MTTSPFDPAASSSEVGGAAAFDAQSSMQHLMQEAARAQQQMFEAQAQLSETRVEGTSGGGLVQATVTGVGELVGLTLSPEAMESGDAETLADLVLAAVRDANASAADLQRRVMEPISASLGLDPGSI